MTEPRTTYRSVLREREVPAFLTAHAVSLTGTVAAEVALSVLVYSRTASPLLAALTLASAFVPQALSAVLLSDVVDRVPARRLLVGCDVACALLVSVSVLPGVPVLVLLLVAAGTGLLAPLFGGARAAALADGLDDASWVLVRSLLRVVSQSALLLGFAVGGLVLAVVGPRTLLAADALSFLGSAALLRWRTSERPARRPAGSRTGLRAGLAASRAALRTTVLRRLLLLSWVPAACFCSVDALATPYAVRIGHGPSAIGLLLAGAATGSVFAEPLGSRLRLVERPRLVLPVAAATGLALLGYLFHPSIAVAVALNVVGGAGFAIGLLLDARLLTELPAAIRGQVLALHGGLMMGIQGAGIALAGALAEQLPPQRVLAGAGVLDLLVVGWLLTGSRLSPAARA